MRLPLGAACLLLMGPAAAPAGPPNLLRNASFESGAEAPDNWTWSASRATHWLFDPGNRVSGSRSVRITQDVGGRGGFRQMVAVKASTRYRLRGRIRGGTEGNGRNSGANLSFTAMGGGKRLADMPLRPVFVGRHEWKLWSYEMVTPPGTDSAVVGFDLGDGAGAAWFDDLELTEVPEPAVSSAPAAEVVGAHPHHFATTGMKKVRSVAVAADGEAGFLLRELLEPMLGPGAVVRIGREQAAAAAADAILVDTKAPLPAETLARLAQDRLVVLSLRSFPSVEFRDALRAPCARILKTGPLTLGFASGDVIPWWSGTDTDGSYVQLQPAGKIPGFEVLAESLNGRPLILWRAGARGGGTLVLDLAMLRQQPDHQYPENLAVTILTNAFGRPQTSLGAYVVPEFDYGVYTRRIQDLARRHKTIAIKEEGLSGGGRPIYSISLGPMDAPALYVDCGIHPIEWAPTWGVLMYLDRLATEFERGLPWARAMLRNRRLKAIPVYAPDTFIGNLYEPPGLNRNRNFPPGWDEYKGETGGKGTAPLSVPEVRVIAEVLKRDRIAVAVNWHETSADTQWVGCSSIEGPYRKYGLSLPGIFRQVIEPGLFYWHAATWTQVTDPRNYHYHGVDSFPYVRNYGRRRSPFERDYAETLGLEAVIVEQVRDHAMSYAATPQRTEITARILETLLGLQLGLVCRNHELEPRRVSIPIEVERETPRAVVYAPSGEEVARGRVEVKDGVARIEAVIPPRGCLVVER